MSCQALQLCPAFYCQDETFEAVGKRYKVI